MIIFIKTRLKIKFYLNFQIVPSGVSSIKTPIPFNKSLILSDVSKSFFALASFLFNISFSISSGAIFPFSNLPYTKNNIDNFRNAYFPASHLRLCTRDKCTDALLG